MSKPLQSWGGVSVENPQILPPKEYLATALSPGGALPYGNGRSYGDSCLTAQGRAVTDQGAGKILAFDKITGQMEVDAGTLLADIIAAAAPFGWFPPVLPGTQFVTVGGAIANDIHGKNHHRKGTFGCHVLEIHLERSDRGRLELTPEDHTGLFGATTGGLGLTGLIRKAKLQLMHVGASAIQQKTTRFTSLEAYFELARKADETHEYAVAWIDSLAKGSQFGRGHLIAGDHLRSGGHPDAKTVRRLSVPFTPPVSPLQGPFLKLFNEAYFRGAPEGVSIREVPAATFFFPLDRIGRWNRLYGPRGLHQHQSVIPEAQGFETVAALLECTHQHRHGSFLTVLKRFGAVDSPGLMSFPRPGYTLTLDFPDKGWETLRLLTKLDEITLEAGGAVNPYKDRRMSADTFKASFPQWQRLETLRDPALLSDFWRRTALVK